MSDHETTNPADNPAGVKLQVASARPEDVGRGIARLDQTALQELGIREGEIIEIVGKRTTAAIAVPPYQEDAGLRIIRLDGFERANADIGIGDQVEIRVAEVKPARKIQLAPAQRNIRLMGPGRRAASRCRTPSRRPSASSGGRTTPCAR